MGSHLELQRNYSEHADAPQSTVIVDLMEYLRVGSKTEYQNKLKSMESRFVLECRSGAGDDHPEFYSTCSYVSRVDFQRKMTH